MRTRAPKAPRSARYPATLLGAFALIAVALGIAPHDRSDWLLKHPEPLGEVAVDRLRQP